MLTRWRNSEPVRLYVYGLVAPVLGVLLVYGLVTEEEAAAWALVLGAALIPGAELARRRVSPARARARRR